MLDFSPIIDELILILTDRCTASCASCPLCCGFNSSHKMDARLAKGLIDQASSLGVRRVTLAGGEPLLLPDLVRELLEHARSVGIKERCVVTNGFWGAWRDQRLEEVVGVLRGLLTHATFCFDAFHAEYVDIGVFWRAVRFVEDMPVQAVIRVADVYGDRGAGAFLASLGEDALLKNYCVYPLRPVGRAEGLPRSWFVGGLEDVGLDAHMPKALCVLWDGCVCQTYYPGIPNTSSCLGDAAHLSLAAMLSGTNAVAS